eukprot:Gregarina_sp_Poly_1__8659@NODE_515_length_7812_cov_238_903163_g409_i0_p9_GENE_NODE_515_length_7812_cov_238_903163_g409_i0NODE_515_length_7812_cov_238_903163_g409_i0_p9_ORF_typecomplete_len106_score7_91Peptidase_C42/PF05533_12/6_8e03Peptidase_C42/PF05533_12/0_0038_NODE_515_length_7812_cov_238_903163_g409_i0446763
MFVQSAGSNASNNLAFFQFTVRVHRDYSVPSVVQTTELKKPHLQVCPSDGAQWQPSVNPANAALKPCSQKHFGAIACSLQFKLKFVEARLFHTSNSSPEFNSKFF